ncbi:MAG: diadenylate cyclase CdaA [Oscillospiraceae bacterium]|nr:diadenylate cyclase CdaA [Oscillospiraceae bacterium]
MTYLSDIFQNFVRVVMSITVFDVIDILLLTYLIYMVFKLMRDTRAEQLMKGILILVLMFIVVQVCQLKVMSFLFENFFQVGLIAIVIVFQPELRRILERVGRAKVPNISLNFDQNDGKTNVAREMAIAGIAEACERLHMTKTGALIVVERQTRLGDITEKATIINAAPEPDLFCNLFYNKAPLHDGAVIIRDNRIFAAGCFLPNTNKDQYLSNDLGSRHRAAIGMSENADSLVIVVSEETGTISVAENGQLTRGLSKESLTKILQRKMPDNAVRSKKKTRKPKPEADGADT